MYKTVCSQGWKKEYYYVYMGERQKFVKLNDNAPTRYFVKYNRQTRKYKNIIFHNKNSL